MLESTSSASECDSYLDDLVSFDTLAIWAILARSSSDSVSASEDSESSHVAIRLFFFSLENFFLGFSF